MAVVCHHREKYGTKREFFWVKVGLRAITIEYRLSAGSILEMVSGLAVARCSSLAGLSLSLSSFYIFSYIYTVFSSLFIFLYSFSFRSSLFFFLCWTADAPSPFNSSYIYILGDVVASARCLLSLLCVIGANIVVNGRTNSLDFSFVLPSDVV